MVKYILIFILLPSIAFCTVTAKTNFQLDSKFKIIDLNDSLSIINIVTDDTFKIAPGDINILNIRAFGARSITESGCSTYNSQTAIDAVLDSLRNWNSANTYKPIIYFPSGQYIINGIKLDTLREITICGDGSGSTQLRLSPGDTAVSLGNYESSPSTKWSGYSPNAVIRDINFRINDHINNNNINSRTAIGIADNRSGGLHLDNCLFSGFKYGVISKTGGDFNNVDQCRFTRCDTAIFAGPGSQQYSIERCQFYECGLAIYAMNGGPIYITNNNSFIDQYWGDISIEVNDSEIYGYDNIIKYASNIIENNWFETGSYSTNWNPMWHIRLSSDTYTSRPRKVLIQNNHLVSGETGMASKTADSTYSFVRSVDGYEIRIINLLIEGERIDFICDNINADHILVENCTAVAGYDTPPPFSDWTSSKSLYVNQNNGRLIRGSNATTNSIQISEDDNSDSSSVRITGNGSDGQLLFENYDEATSNWHVDFWMDHANETMGGDHIRGEQSLQIGGILGASATFKFMIVKDTLCSIDIANTDTNRIHPKRLGE